MKKIALMFPGQGSQYVGMGSKLSSEKAKSIIERANDALKMNLKKLMFEGPNEELGQTTYTQPAIVAHSLALLEEIRPVLERNQSTVKVTLGHSVGEYAALVASGSLDVESALQAVYKRGQFMQKAVPLGEGTMVAILKVDEDTIEKACKEVSKKQEMVMPANFNAPGQVVISGNTKACKRAIDWLKMNYAGPHRCIELNVSAPFHSSLMQPAAEQMLAVLRQLPLRPNKIPYIANVDAHYYPENTPAEKLLQNLYTQIEGSVRWTESINKLDSDFLVVEVGPGRVLSGLVKKINPHLQVISLDHEKALEELEGALV